jgi:hypothetical protein
MYHSLRLLGRIGPPLFQDLLCKYIQRLQFLSSSLRLRNLLSRLCPRLAQGYSMLNFLPIFFPVFSLAFLLLLSCAR